MALDERRRMSLASRDGVRGHVALVVALSAACWSATGCGTRGDQGPDPAALRADRIALDAALSRDGSRGVLREVDEALEDRLPVRAAEMLRGAAVPALHRLRVAIEAETLRTDPGRAMRARALEVLQARARAMEQYADALARGEVEDERLLAALHAHRLAEQRWLRLLDDAHALDGTKVASPVEAGSRRGWRGAAASSGAVPGARSGGSP